MGGTRVRALVHVSALVAASIAWTQPVLSQEEGGDRCGRRASIVGTEGDDVLEGTPGHDNIAGLGGNDVIRGLDGSDSLCGGDGDDQVFGGKGGDHVEGSDGNDSVDGGPGNDYIQGNLGNDALIGDAGFDTTVFSRSDSAQTIDLAAGTASGGMGDDTIAEIEEVWGSTWGDTIIGSDGPDRIWLGEATDEVDGGGGDD
ncbi:MAG TPA: calcium-binding protein, partial [Actinomycetota bacterium]|nr:calcium-binding protein [Actinomycetota bacterium]